MPYYDIYDINDNLIASEVWIDTEGGPSRPIVINWYKILVGLILIVGFVSTFITPINLFIHKEAFINNGWIYMSLMNLIMGVPVLVIAFNMMMVMIKKIKEDDPCYDSAYKWVSEHFNFTQENDKVDDETEISDEEYVASEMKANKKETIIASVYVSIKYKKLLNKLSKISYLIYPLSVVALIVEALGVEEEMFFIIMFNFNFIAMFCGILSIYRNYRIYKKMHCEKIKGRIIKTVLISFLVSVPLVAIISSLAKSDGYYIFVFCIGIMDFFMIVDGKMAKKAALTMGKKKNSVRLGVVVVCTVCFTLLMLTVACGISLIPGPIYEAILAYDEGRSTNLFLPIIFWSLCFIVDILLIVIVSKVVSKKLN